jgi:hypothetical protein
MRVSITDNDGNERGFTFSLKRFKADDVWLDIKKTIEDKINEDNNEQKVKVKHIVGMTR